MKNVLTAFAEQHYGPGWANQTITAVVMDVMTGEMGLVCLQHDEWTEEMETLFRVCEAANAELTRAVKEKLRGGGNEHAISLRTNHLPCVPILRIRSS